MVHSETLCRLARCFDCRKFRLDSLRLPNLLFARLQLLQLSAGAISPRMFLARRTAALEPVQFLRHAVPRAMEYADTLSAVAHLPGAPIAVVAQRFLCAASFRRRPRHVFPRTPMDEASFRCERRGIP